MELKFKCVCVLADGIFQLQVEELATTKNQNRTNLANESPTLVKKEKQLSMDDFVTSVSKTCTVYN